jgi:ADP-heptose:LPS heptosyltransferase
MSNKKNKFLISLKATLLKLLCFKQRRLFNLDEVKTILILRYDRIGDMVVTTPLFSSLRNGFPKARIIVLASPTNASVIVNNPDVDEIIIFPKKIMGRMKILLGLRHQNVSMVVDTHHDIIWHAIYAIRIINPLWVASSYKKSRYGVDGKDLRLFDFIGNVNEKHMIYEIYSGIANSLGLNNAQYNVHYSIVLSELQKRFAKSYITCGLNVGINLLGSKAGWELKEFDCIKLCTHILGKYPSAKIWLLATPSSYQIIKALSLKINNLAVNVVHPTDDVMDAAAIIADLNLLITPDTSLVHIACAFNTRLVAIYPNAPDAYQNWQPLHLPDHFRVIFSKSDKSLEGYDYESVKAAVDQLIEYNY